MPDSCPTWDLTDLYADIGDASIKADIEACRSSANGLAANWQGRLETAERLLRRAVEAGVRPLPESFWAVLQALGRSRPEASLSHLPGDGKPPPGQDPS